MVYRIISGIVNPGGSYRASGNVTFHFSDHSILPRAEARVTEVHDTENRAPRRRFLGVPCKIVALRQIKVEETERPIPRERIETDFFRLGDEIDQDWIQISWEATGGSLIEEISFMVIGQVSGQ